MAASVTPQEGGRERESEKETVRGRECVRERGNSSPTRSDCKRLIERAVLLISSFMENMTGRLINQHQLKTMPLKMEIQKPEFSLG